MNTDMRISEAMQCVCNNADDIVTQFMTSGWGCKKARGTQFYQQFTHEYVTSVGQSCAELTHSELDMTILGQIVASVNTSGTVSIIKAHHKEADHERGTVVSLTKASEYATRCFDRFLHGIGVK